MRARLAGLAVAGVLVACSEVPTAPGSKATSQGLADLLNGCPAAFTSTTKVVADANGNTADANGDGSVCQLDVLDPDDNATIHTTYVDNNVPSQVGACPEGFEAKHAIVTKEGATDDHNGDGYVCEATRPNGTIVTIDNRFDVQKGVQLPEEPREETK